MKKIITLLSVICCCVGVMAEDIPNDEIWYTSIDGKVVKPYDTSVFGAEIVSNTYSNGKGIIKFDGTVASIGRSAFENCSSLTSINIPHSVTSIGRSAFWYCRGLTIINIPNAVTSIGDYAFEYCRSLASINMPNSVANIGADAFYGCSNVDSIYWDSDVSPHHLIQYCSKNLKTVVLGDNITSIRENAFEDCSSLISITIPNSVISIGESAFFGCRSLTSITIPNSVIGIGESAFSGCSSLPSITIPNSVKSMSARIFEGCSGLISISIPNSVKSIGEYAFSGCGSLTSIEMPNSVTSIGSFAFEGCSSIESLYWDSEASPSCVLQYCKENLKTVVLGERITSIGSYAFSDCSSLTSVTIGNSVTSIGQYAFSDCSSLTSVTIGNSVTSIGQYAFSDCSGLTSIVIPNSVTDIGIAAFYNCSGLTIIEIPNSVTSIGGAAFYNCCGLTSIALPNLVTSIGESAFSRCSGLISIKVDESNKTYDSRKNCNAIVETASNTLICGCENTIIPNSVTSIGNAAFFGCIGMTSTMIPNSVTSIGNEAFLGCIGMTSIKIPNSVISIGNDAFYWCIGLTSIEIPNSVTSIGDNAFYGCSNIESLYWDSNVFPSCLTEYCNETLKSVVLGDNITVIGNSTFKDCSSLISVTIGNSVTSIGDYAFEGCSGLQSIEMSANIQEVGAHAFDGCNVFECERLEIGQLYAKFKTSTTFTSSAGIKVKINDSEADEPDGIIIVKGKPNKSYSSPCKVYCNGTLIYQSNNVSFTTKSLLPNLNYESNPTQIIISSVSYLEEDAKVVKTEVWNPITGEFVTGGIIRLTNLTPNTSYKIPYRVYYGTGKDDYEGGSNYVYTNSLTLKTETPKVVNSTSAVVAATTNIPNDEVSVGFEWRKIDAPEEIPSKSGGAVIYNGRMEGKIMNLQTDSYYKVRAYYESRDGKKYYGEWVGFDPSDFSYFEPTVHTYAMASAQTSNSVKVRGYAVAGTDDLDDQGFEYSEVGSIAEPKRVSATGQLMTATLEGLKYNTSYNVRAYVKTSSKTVYGETVTFKTPYTDGIEEITVDTVQERTIQGVYDMQGRLISRDSNIDLSTLKQGVYIVNGKKVLIK